MPRWVTVGASLLFAAVLAACGGDDGADGAQGPQGEQGVQGPAGPAGPAGADLTSGTVNAAQLTFTDLKDTALVGKILSADVSGDQPVVQFQVVRKDTNEGVSGLRTFSLHISQLKPAVNGSASYWLNYIADGLPAAAMPAAAAAPVNPGTDAVTSFNADGTMKAQGYSVTDHNDGTYTVKFGAKIKQNTKVVFDPSLTHRVVVGVRSVAVPGNYINAAGVLTPNGSTAATPGAYGGPLNPLTGANIAQFVNTSGVNLAYDFTPSTTGAGTPLASSARDIVTIDACNKCHYQIEYGFPKGNNTSGHFGSRTDTKTCVMCHTPQNTATKQVNGTGAGDMTSFIHKIHMGEELPSTELMFWSTTETYNEITYPQDQRNCTTCHKGTVPNSWQLPTAKACGACHNDVNFTTGANHVGREQPDDSKCALCHSAANIATDHTPVAAVANSNVPSINSYYSDNSALPAGAYKLGWALKSVTVDSARKVSVQFQVLKDGAAVNFGTYNATTNPNIIPNTVGGPSIRIAYNVTQDGITSPADFNTSISVPAIGVPAPTVTRSDQTPPNTFTPPALQPGGAQQNLWVNGTLTVSGITWTMTGPDASNTYTVKSSLPLPASTTMVMALMYGTMTQTNAPGPTNDPTRYAFKASSIADFTSYVNSSGATAWVLTKPGLVLTTANAKASYTNSSAGFVARRTVVDNAKCSNCHDQLGVKPTFHGGGRNDGTTCTVCHLQNSQNSGWSYSANTFVHGIHGAAQRTKAYTFTEDWSGVTYPGLLKNCEQCHVAGTYDFSASTSSSVVGKMLFNTVGVGKTTTATATTSPYITIGVDYGTGFSVSTSTGAVVTTEAAATTLVSSPITAACVSCHDSASAISHFKTNAGSFYEPRSTALAKTESCLVCHGTAASIFNETPPAIKVVHRWW
jgi:OmcA/MtrC family decaheme c-type cytochrome